jgi:hypothetical protein
MSTEEEEKKNVCNFLLSVKVKVRYSSAIDVKCALMRNIKTNFFSDNNFSPRSID